VCVKQNIKQKLQLILWGNSVVQTRTEMNTEYEYE